MALPISTSCPCSSSSLLGVMTDSCCELCLCWSHWPKVLLPNSDQIVFICSLRWLKCTSTSTGFRKTEVSRSFRFFFFTPHLYSIAWFPLGRYGTGWFWRVSISKRGPQKAYHAAPLWREWLALGGVKLNTQSVDLTRVKVRTLNEH